MLIVVGMLFWSYGEETVKFKSIAGHFRNPIRALAMRNIGYALSESVRGLQPRDGEGGTDEDFNLPNICRTLIVPPRKCTDCFLFAAAAEAAKQNHFRRPLLALLSASSRSSAATYM